MHLQFGIIFFVPGIIWARIISIVTKNNWTMCKLSNFYIDSRDPPKYFIIITNYMSLEPSLITIQLQLAIICKCPRSSPKWQFVAIMKKLHISPSNYILQTNGRDTKWAVTCDEYYFHAGVNCDGEDTQNWPENSLWSDELLTLTTTLNATKRTRTVCVKDINTLSLEMDNEFLLLLCFKILQFLLIRFLSFASQKVNGRQGEMYP